MKRLLTILSFGVFLLLFLEFFHPITAITQDLGRHVKTGRIIVQTHSVPKINLFSYTYPSFPFINSHWLSEVVFYLISQTVGFHGLLIFTTAITLLAFGLLFFTAYRLYPSRFTFYSLILTSLLYLGILAERTDVRPEIFSFLFCSIFVSVLYQYKKAFSRWIFLLPVIELFWVNMHIYFAIGEILLGIFILDEIISHRKNLFQKHFFILCGIFIASCLATLINPNFLHGALYPLTVFSNYGYTIQENASILFLLQYAPHTSIYFFIATALLFCIMNTFLRTKPLTWFLSLLFTYLGAIAIRNMALFVFITFIPFVSSLTSVFQKIYTSKSFHSALGKRKALFFVLGSSIVLLLFFWQGYTFFVKQGFGWEVPSGAKPAADFFLKNNLHGPIFNNFDIGSYLDYRLYPKEKVFVDGRPEAYPASFFKNTYIPMQTNSALFQAIDNRYHFNTIFWAHTDQTPWAADFIHQIMNNPRWTLVYLDDQIVILVKNTEENKTVREKFGMDKNSVSLDMSRLTSMNQLLYLANFFITANWPNQEIKIDHAMLILDSNFCPAISRLATLYSQTNSPSASIYEAKYAQFCNQ